MAIQILERQGFKSVTIGRRVGLSTDAVLKYLRWLNDGRAAQTASEKDRTPANEV